MNSPDYFCIPRVTLVLRPEFGPAESIETESSLVFFRLLRIAAVEHTEIRGMAIEGRDLTADSLGALNSFLRAGLATGRTHLHPWDRLVHFGHDTRHEWAELCRHLELNVEPVPA